MTSLHSRLGIVSPLLDKLWRRKESTQIIADRILTSGTWQDYDLEGAKPLDNESKASEEYYHAFDKVVSK